MPAHSKLLLGAAFAGILIMGLAGWWVGTLGQPQPDPAPAPAAQPAPDSAPPLVADLKKDWSGEKNPNPVPAGAWSFNQDTSPLVKIDHWASGGMPGWGPSANAPVDFLPFICQAATDGDPSSPLGVDYKSGDIIIHATDPSNSARDGLAIICFKAAVSGTASVKGSLWPTRTLERVNDWRLVLASSDPVQTLATGSLPESGAVTREDPALIDVQPFRLRADDTLQLIVFRNSGSPYADFTAVNLTIAITPESAATPAAQSAVLSSAPTPAAAPTSAQRLNLYNLLSFIFSSIALILAVFTSIGVILLLLRQRAAGRSTPEV